METLSASDAKREFGEVLLKVQKGPVRINKNGKPVAVVVSAADYADIETLKRTLIQQEIQKGLEDIDAGRVNSGLEVLQRL
ncbi:MAG: type II toxin-antitoxin system Phd/YefM family antitoxin [Immundisolibacteraceae bacterium]|nr:type II toxin-antitoxin system Phd/YefM family antitoxin [Immundisolibacteraceae bacterium]